MNRKGHSLALLAMTLIAPAMWEVPAPGPANPPDGAPGILQLAEAQGVRKLSDLDQAVFFHGFVRGGIRRESLIILPGGRFETGPLPEDRGRGRCISLFAAMPFNLGDGAELEIFQEEPGHTAPVGGVRLDPAHHREHRDWIPIKLDIPRETRELGLIFEVRPGPRGDVTGDWLGIAPGPDRGCLFSENMPASGSR